MAASGARAWHRAGWLAAGLLLALLAACSREVPDTHPQQVLTKRNAIFKQMNRALEPIGQVAQGRKDYRREEFLAQVQDLEKISSKPWAYFPADGNYPPTRARPEVWSQPERFQAAKDDYQQKVKGLVAAAETGDIERIRAATDATSRSCKSCHDSFRSE